MNEKGVIPLLFWGVAAIALLVGGVVTYKIGFWGSVQAGGSCGLLSQPCVSGTECLVSDPFTGRYSCQVTSVPQFFFDSLRLDRLVCGTSVTSGACGSLLPLLTIAIAAIALGLVVFFFFPSLYVFGALLGGVIGFILFSFLNQWWWALLLFSGLIGIVFSMAKK